MKFLKKLISELSLIKNNNATKRSLYLYGVSGIGKTTLIKEFAQKMRATKRVQFINVVDWENEIKSNWSKGTNDVKNFVHNAKDLAKNEILIIDDLGAENIKGIEKYFYDLFDEIINNETQVIIASNLSLAKLEQRWNVRSEDSTMIERIISRICGSVDLFYELDGVDHRKDKHYEKNTN